MCEFCLKHSGEGRKWYLEALNCSEDLLEDVKRRSLLEGLGTFGQDAAKGLRRLERLEKAPRFVRSAVDRIITRRMKVVHFGQVVPIEEIEKIFEFINSITRVAFFCGHVTPRGEALLLRCLQGTPLPERDRPDEQGFRPGSLALLVTGCQMAARAVQAPMPGSTPQAPDRSFFRYS
ncbi:hypothetical protein JW921_05555 [Candidatus Fermentibacterales bacterium]|nr:hypothetical protein [Candidatus Fermentibacterales bacterium]